MIDWLIHSFIRIICLSLQKKMERPSPRQFWHLWSKDDFSETCTVTISYRCKKNSGQKKLTSFICSVNINPSNTFYSQKLFLHLIFEVHIVELSATSIMLAVSFLGFQHPLFLVLQSYFLYNLILNRRIFVFHSMYVKTWNFCMALILFLMKCFSLMKSTKKYFFLFQHVTWMFTRNVRRMFQSSVV